MSEFDPGEFEEVCNRLQQSDNPEARKLANGLMIALKNKPEA